MIIICGIAGIFLRGEFNAHEKLEVYTNTMLEQIEHRGRRATGIVSACAGGHQVMLDKKPVTAKEFIKGRKALPEKTRIVMCHTRLDTQGSPENNENNHPIVYRSMFMTHNGCIWNDASLFEDNGLNRNAQVDSEIIAALLSDTDDPRLALEQLEGDFAIAAMDPINKPDEVILAKGAYSPLYVWENDFFVTWASTEMAIKKACEAVDLQPPTTDDMYEFDSGELWTLTMEGVRKGEFTLKTDDTYSAAVKQAKRDARTSEYNWAASRTSRYGQHSETNSDYWVKCEVCFHHVPYREIAKTAPVHTPICEECDRLGLTPRGRTGSNSPLVSNDEKRVLELWCTTDQEINDRVIRFVSEETGYDASTVEWLVFRAPQEYLKSHDNMGQLADYLDDLYQKEYHKEWTKFNDFTNTDGSIEDAAMVADAIMAGQMESTEGDACGVKVVKDDEEEEGKVIPFPKALPRGRSKDFSCFSAETYSDKCRVCNIQADVRLGKFVWCNRHNERCNSENCPRDRGNAIGTDTQGRRLCHVCLRGVKGSLTDSMLVNKGFKLEAARV